MTPSEESRRAAMHFRRARSQAHLQDILARLTGRPNDLIAFEDARRSLHGSLGGERELREIPLDAIVGSVGRYTDFTRQFLPRYGDESRWSRVMAAMNDPRGTPPIKVYQIGEAYFVLDGNHRVSVARQRGSTHIHAYVTTVVTRVPLPAGATPDDLILLAEAADFFELTDLDHTRPDANLSVTNPGQHQALLADIEVRRVSLAAQGLSPSFAEVAADWYDTVYLPVVEIIRGRGLLHDFPGRTETDLYVWISRHRARLEATLGWAFDPEAAAADLAADPTGFDPAAHLAEARARARALASEPPTGIWRRERRVEQGQGRHALDLLVPLSGEPESWGALDQALIVAAHQGGHLHGLHVQPEGVTKDTAHARELLEEFDRRCNDAGVAGSLAFEVGPVVPTIVARARWSDLVVVNLAHPPQAKGLARVRSGFHALVQHCPRPLLAVPGQAVPIGSALLSYDGSPKAAEALFVTAYLALQWGVRITVLTVPEPLRTGEQALARARRYLEVWGVQADYLLEPGQPAQAILSAARERGCDLILIGGYGHSPLLEAVLGGTVDQLLRSADRPVLICR
jgi:nucleotide-binding universal stress UspA family protein